MSQTQNKLNTFSPAILKRIIHWVRIGLVPHPRGVRLVVNQIVFALDQRETTLEELGTDQQEVQALWYIASSATDETDCLQQLKTYYRDHSSLAGAA